MNRKQREKNRQSATLLLGSGRVGRVTCQNCGGEGSHFVPPCLGEPGFFICGTDSRARQAALTDRVFGRDMYEGA